MDLVIFEENKPLVLQALENGEFDYIEAASEVFETEFFRFIQAKQILRTLAKTYPTPREKEQVPVSFYIASDLSMRLHGAHSFHAYPLVVRAGGMLNAFGSEVGRKVTHPDTGDTTLTCQGFNDKNHYDRQTPCDQDFLRKMAKDTEPDSLMRWFARDVVRVFRGQRIFDPEGIFIGDASYLFVPDNPNYEGSVKLLFDEHNHPVSRQDFEKMSNEQKMRCQLRRCYKMVSLLHTNRDLEFFLFVGVRVISGRAHECPVLFNMVGQFVQAAGKRVMKRLILDRGFLDGESITTCKKKYGVDILIPVRRNMDVYEDAMALFELPDVKWVPYEKPNPEPLDPPRPRPKAVQKRERKRQATLKKRQAQLPPPPAEKVLVQTHVAAIGDFRSWSTCKVPLTVIANRERYADGHEDRWFLLDTQRNSDPLEARQTYHLRTSIEERHKQLKGFSDLTHFTSRAFSLVVHQVVFILLTLNLLNLYLLRKGREDLTGKTLPRIRQQLLPSANHVIVYWQTYYAFFHPLEFVEIIASAGEEARRKLAGKSRRLRRELIGIMTKPRPPPFT